MNMVTSEKLIKALLHAGVAEFVVCSGSRNSPLVLTLDGAKSLKVWSHFEERAAGFWALGRARRLQRPVAVVVTSGTAVAELFPSVIEAHYQNVPLILVSADRPSRFAETGFPQSMDQNQLFGKYASFEHWGEENERLNGFSESRPHHINVAFDEPLVDRPVSQQAADSLKVETNFAKTQTDAAPSDWSGDWAFSQPLLVVSGDVHHHELDKSLPRLGRPIWIEGTSGWKNAEPLLDLQIKSGEKFLSHLYRRGEIDSVIRIGDIPTCRFWRDLDKLELPVVHFSHKPWPGLAGTQSVSPLSQWESFCRQAQWKELSKESFQLDQQLAQTIDSLLLEHPECEPAWVRSLHMLFEQEDFVYLGNSMPVRLWDGFASQKWVKDVKANRGVNGIDGQLASFFSLAERQKKNHALLGDLTTLYDLNSFLLAPDFHWQVFVLNNQGGQIFRRLYQEPIFRNEHQLEFHRLGDFFSIPSQRWERNQQLQSGAGLTEIVVDKEQDLAFEADLEKTVWNQI